MKIKKTIRIQEINCIDSCFDVSISIDEGNSFLIKFKNPINTDKQQLLDWYFETFYYFPFFFETKKAKDASTYLKTYGESLAKQLFYSNRELELIYSDIVLNNLYSLRFEIVGSHSFNNVFWELLKDPKIEQPFSVTTEFIRSVEKKGEIKKIDVDSFNILIVSARTSIEEKIPHNIISKPLVEISKDSKFNFKIDILRPATFISLKNHLDKVQKKHGNNYYQIIHFDTHGDLLEYSQYKRICDYSSNKENIIPFFNGLMPFIFFEGKFFGEVDAIDADKLSILLSDYKIPIIVLNACKSGKQINNFDTNFSSILLKESGCNAVLGMRYSVSAATAKKMMTVIYESIFYNKTFSEAVLDARKQLYFVEENTHDDPNIKDDWFIPIFYEKTSLSFSIKQQIINKHYKKIELLPILGRDKDILYIESLILRKNQNIIPIIGHVGEGKTVFAQYLGQWWEQTNFIKEFEYIDLLETGIPYNFFDNIKDKVFGQDNVLEEKERYSATDLGNTKRFLIILDNVDKITDLSTIGNLIAFLRQIKDSQAIILLISRGNCSWFENETLFEFGYRLPKINKSAEIDLAKRELKAIDREDYLMKNEFYFLLDFANGNPSCLLNIIRCLKNNTPKKILQFIYNDINDEYLWNSLFETNYKDFENSIDKMEPNTSAFWLYFSSFSHTIHKSYIRSFLEICGRNDLIDNIDNALLEGIKIGLVSYYSEYSRCFELHPHFHFYAKKYLMSKNETDFLMKCESTYSDFYESYIMTLFQSLTTNDSNTTYLIIGLEKENIKRIIIKSIKKNQSILMSLSLLSNYYKINDKSELFISFIEFIESILSQNPFFDNQQYLDNKISIEIEKAGHLSHLKKYDDAINIYKEIESIIDSDCYKNYNKSLETRKIISMNLGIAYRHKNDLITAEEYYMNSLKINVESINKDIERGAYLDLAIIRRKQENYTEAEMLLKKSLKIAIEKNDKVSISKCYHELGFIYYHLKKYNLSINRYNKSSKLKLILPSESSKISMRKLNMAVTYQAIKEYDNAKSNLKSALEMTTDKDILGKVYAQLSSVEIDLGNFEQALDYALKSFKQLYNTENNEDWIKLLGHFNWLWKDAKLFNVPNELNKLMNIGERAVSELLNAVSDQTEMRFDNINNLNSLKEEANKLFLSGKYQESLKVLDTLIGLYPDNPTFHYSKSIACSHIGDYDKAIESVSEVIKLSPNDSFAYYDRANYYIHKELYNEALNDYNKAISISPQEPDFYIRSASLKLQMNLKDEAINDLEKALRIEPNNSIAYLSLGEITKNNDEIAAIEYFNKSIENISYLKEKRIKNHRLSKIEEFSIVDKEISNTLVSAYFERAAMFRSIKKYDEAINDYDCIINIHPNHYDAYNLRSISHYGKGEFDLGIDDCKHAIAINPNYAGAYYNLACGYSLKKDVDNSIIYLNRAIELDKELVRDTIMDDEDFSNIKDDQKFIKLITQNFT